MKIRWIVILIIVIVVLSYFSQSFVVLNPKNGVWTTTRNTNLTSGTFKVAGLLNPVNIIVDESGVAHINAENNHDLFYAQGYYTASNRLFQMELQALVAAGNLSNYIGKAGLSSDKAIRLIGIPTNAMTLVKSYEKNYPEYFSYLKDYSDGVNAYINQTYSSPPLGFKLLNFQPFQWSVFYTLAWREYMGWSLTTGAGEPLSSALIYDAFGFNKTMEIWPYYPYFTQNLTVVPGNGTVNGYNLEKQNISSSYLWSLNWYDQWATGINTSKLKLIGNLIRGALSNISDPYVLPGVHNLGSQVGSNSWVVTANYSKLGYPIMANDPHLPLLAPSVWIPMQLKDPSFNVTGWELAGEPGILIGHTQHTAWGLTTPEGNSANVYLETLNNDSYLYDGTWHSMTVLNYTLLGKQYSVYCTNNGPLLSRNSAYGISLNWVNRYPSYDLIAETLLDQSKNFSDMVNALKFWGSPPQNFAMASDHHAGILTAGTYPLINETLPDGKNVEVVGSRSLLNGSSGQYEPMGNVSFQYLPQKFDPQRGYMFAPNQPTVGPEYPYPFVGGFWASGGRAEAIYQFLKSNPNMTTQKMMELQSNTSDYWAAKLTPHLIDALGSMNMNSTEQQAFSYLKGWNFTTYQNQIGITVYWYLLSELYNLSFGRQYAKYNLTSVSLPFVTSITYLVENDPNSQWFDGNFTSLIREAFSKEVAFLTQHLGIPSDWNWGRVHLLEISSLTGLSALSIGPIPIWGDSHSVSVGGVPLDIRVPEPFVSVGSSLRTVASPGSNEFYGVFPGGPNENILSYYFSNQLNNWFNHRYYNMNDQKTEVTLRYE